MYFGQNIKFLRKRRGLTQEDVSNSLNLKRSTLNNYENLVAQPGMASLIAISDYYKVAIDTLIRVDLPKLPESQVRQIEKGYDVFIRGTDLRVLARCAGVPVETAASKASRSSGEKGETGFITSRRSAEEGELLSACTCLRSEKSKWSRISVDTWTKRLQ